MMSVEKQRSWSGLDATSARSASTKDEENNGQNEDDHADISFHQFSEHWTLLLKDSL